MRILDLTVSTNWLGSRLFTFLASQSSNLAPNQQLLRDQLFLKGSSFRRAAQDGVILALGNTALWVLREQEETLREGEAAISLIHFRLTIPQVTKTAPQGQVGGKKKISNPPTVGIKVSPALLHLVQGLILSKLSHQLLPPVVPTRG